MSRLAEPHHAATGRPNPKFRDDINGLRAIAVLSVLAFHFDLPFFQGGFVGVDVFFVISGFLMTQIIVSGLDAGRFGLFAFYGARVNRIVPALLVLLAALLLFGALAVDPNGYEEMAKAAATSALFVSNIQYGFENGYFTDASEANWLLHTWSLSAEWQFYLVYPLVLMLAARFPALWKRRSGAVLVATAVLFVATVAFCALSWRALQVGFFLLPTRAWEMLAGGAVALAAPSAAIAARARQIRTAGLVLIAASVLLIPPDWPWPSALTLVPVLGTALVIRAGDRSAAWARLPGVQAVGRWSYSIYLWHWPLVVGLGYFGHGESSLAIAAGAVASIVMGALSYVLVESRFHGRPAGRTAGRRGGVIAGAFVAVGALAGAALATDGMERFKLRGLDVETVAALADYDAAAADWLGGAGCPGPITGFSGPPGLSAGRRCDAGPAGGRRVLVIGDSHAQQLLPRLLSRGDRLASGVTVLYNVGCPPLPGVNRSMTGYDCPAFTDAALREAETGSYSDVILVGAWTIYLAQPAVGGVSTELCTETAFGCRMPVDQPAAEALVMEGARALNAAVRRLTAQGVTVWVAGPYPTAPIYAGHEGAVPSNAGALYRATWLAGRPVRLPDIPAERFRAETRLARAALDAVMEGTAARFIDPSAYWCGGLCTAYGRFGYPFRDAHHIRASIVTSDEFDYFDAALGLSP